MDWHAAQKKVRQKGQDMVEYALMLAIIVGIGWGVYSASAGSLPSSISSVFGNAGSLLGEASSHMSAQAGTILHKLVAAKDGGNSNMQSYSIIGSYDAEHGLDGRDVSKAAGIDKDMTNYRGSNGSQDAWFMYKDGGNTYFVYYNPEDNNGVNFKDAKAQASDAWNHHRDTFNSLAPVNISYSVTDANGRTTYGTGKGTFQHASTENDHSNVNYYIKVAQ